MSNENQLREAPAAPVSDEQSKWCEYVAGMVSGWIGMEGSDDIHAMGDERRTKAIAGIIERRLWALRPAPAQSVGASADDVADRLYDSAWISGAKFGWNCGVAGDNAQLNQCIEARLRERVRSKAEQKPRDTVAAPAAPTWDEALRISEVPEVDEALRNFANGENTEDQAVCIVQAVMKAAQGGAA